MKLTAQGGEPCIKVYDRRIKSDLSKRADPGLEIFYIRESVCASEPRPGGSRSGEERGEGKVVGPGKRRARKKCAPQKKESRAHRKIRLLVNGVRRSSVKHREKKGAHSNEHAPSCGINLILPRTEALRQPQWLQQPGRWDWHQRTPPCRHAAPCERRAGRTC